ncbi:hypothetical protein AB205_0113360, partial [Aquarana catesbeiana]
MKSDLLCVHIQDATKDTSNCPICRCTVESTQVRNLTSVILKTVRGGFLARTNLRGIKDDTQVC